MAGGATLNGFDELMDWLSEAPDAIRVRAREALEEEATGASIDVASQYAVKTGRLRRGVKVVFPASGVLIARVLSTAPHSHIYEFGTKQRFTKRYGNKSQRVNRGQMPVRKVTPKVGQRRRDRLNRRLVRIVEDYGFVVKNG